MNPSGPAADRGKYLALTAALLGWMFDGLEMGLFPLVARDAIKDLLKDQLTDPVLLEGQVSKWFGVATASFLVGAATGGVLFGWLGDRLGRVRAMTLSVLTYALFSGLCGLAANPEQIAVLRFVSALGMGGEWSLGVALVMEIWPDKSRAFLAGLIGAAANVGYLLVALLGMGLTAFLAEVKDLLLGLEVSKETVDTLMAGSGWRIIMMLGAFPALLTFFIRLFVPESARWKKEQGQGTTSHWAARDLAGMAIGAIGAIGIIFLWASQSLALVVQIAGTVVGLVLATAGYLYPVFRYLERSRETDKMLQTGPTLRCMFLGACLGGVALLGTWASLQWANIWADQLNEREVKSKLYPALAANIVLPGSGLLALAPIQDVAILKRNPLAKAHTQFWSAFGAILGTIGGALLGSWVGRRLAYLCLCLGALGSSLLFFQLNTRYGGPFLATVFLAGGLTAAFYGWLPLYLPELFQTRVRATGQGFSFNFGRILAAIGALQTGYLINEVLKGDYATACSVMSLIYLVGVAIIWLAPETKGQPLPE